MYLVFTGLLKTLNSLRTSYAFKKFKMPKKEKIVTAFYNESVSTFFQFFEKKFGFRPSFDGSAPRDLKNILDAMKQKTEDKSISWTRELSQQMLLAFLEMGYNDPWIKENYFLFNLNRQKDKLFFKLKNRNDGTSKTGFTREGVNAEFERRYNAPRNNDDEG